MTFPAEKPSVTYVYHHPCRECGVMLETRRPPGDGPSAARFCKRCKWRLRARRYNARYPKRVYETKTRWSHAHPDAKRAHARASYHRHLEENRKRNREYSREHPKSGARYPWESGLARAIRQIAMV